MLRPIHGISTQYIRTHSITPDRPEQIPAPSNPEADAPTAHRAHSIPRSLNRVIKIAGEPAQLIFSNANGMECCGYQFLHTNRLVLTTGEPVLNRDGEFQAFRLKTGQITIQSKTTLKGYEQIDVIAYSIKIEGELYANKINLNTAVNGSNLSLPVTLQQDIADTTIHSEFPRQLQFTGTAKVKAKEHLSIQADTLDNASSQIQSNGNITLKANRLIGAGTLGATLDLTAKLEEHYTHRTQLNAGRHLSISTAQSFTNQGTLKTRGEITLKAKTFENQSTSLIDGVHLKFKVENVLKNYGVIQGSTVVIDTQHLLNDGTEDTDEQQAGAILGRDQLMLGARTLHNQEHGLLHSDGDLTIGDAFYKQNTVTDLAKEFMNAEFSTVESRGKLLIKAIFLNNQKGQITAGSDLVLESDTLTNDQGHIEAKGDQSVLKVRADIINNHSGYLIHNGAGPIQIVADMMENHNVEAIKGAGLISSKGPITISVAKLSNHQGGTILSDQTLKIGTFYTASLVCYLKNLAGTLSAHQKIEIGTYKLDNSKGLIAVGKEEASEPEISSDPDRSTQPTHPGSVLEICAHAVINTEGGQIVQSGQGEIKIFLNASGSGYEAQNGLMSAQGRITIEAPNIVHTNKSQMTGKDLNLVIGERILNQANATLFARDRLSLKALALDNMQQGVLQSEGRIFILAMAFCNEGTIHSQGEIRILSNKMRNRRESGTLTQHLLRLAIHPGLITGDTILISARGPDSLLRNTESMIFAQNSLQIGVHEIQNRAGGTLYSGGDLAIGRKLNAESIVQGRSERILNHGSTMDAVGDLTIHAKKLVNQNARFEIEERLIEERGIHECHDDQTNQRFDGSQIAWHGDVGGLYRVHSSGHEIFRFINYVFTRRVTTTRVTHSEPGKIQAGGAISLSDQVMNDKSMIIAGGALSDLEGRPAQIENRDAIGQRVTTDRGTSQYSDREWHGGISFFGSGGRYWERKWSGQAPYHPAPIVEHHTLTVAVSQEHTAVEHSAPSTALVPSSSALSRNTLLNSGLLHLNTDPNQRYLIQIDPRFTRHSDRVSSDVLLRLLNLDPQHIPKRLGDGLYEQQLIRDQIIGLTGHYYLSSYHNPIAEIRDLMHAGADWAKRFNLMLGIEPTPEQINALTTSPVWLVNQRVQLPDGSEQTVLVPKVYLAPSDAPAIPRSNALISADTIELESDRPFKNTGTVLSRSTTRIRASQIDNQRGTLASRGTLSIQARDNIDSRAGKLIAVKKLTVQAGQNLQLQSQTQTTHAASGSRTNLVGLTQIQAEELEATAGSDLHLAATQIEVEHTARLDAQQDLILGTATTGLQQKIVWDERNALSLSQHTEVGTQIQAGALELKAGRDVTATGAYVKVAEKLAVKARRDIHLEAALSPAQLN
ncbi:adhesin [Mycoavidus sp. B2-EB]|nr:adhesin [Mycoavidus sp. B2-EB]